MIRFFFLLLLASLVAAPAAAADMAFYMKNNVGRAVAVELRSQSRAHAWPGDDKVYLLEVGEKKSVPVTCEPGERICFGAWQVGNDRVYWGVGPDNARRCDDCCTICTSKSTYEIDLAR